MPGLNSFGNLLTCCRAAPENSFSAVRLSSEEDANAVKYIDFNSEHSEIAVDR